MSRAYQPFVFAALASFSVLSPASSDEASPGADRRWNGAHAAFGGETLDPAWFSGRRAVVYLLPDGDMLAVRRAAAAIMRDRWIEGDWSLKHVFVSDVSNRVRFAARQRLAVHAIATDVTTEAGQGPEFVSDNEDFVRKQVFFVSDPEGSIWKDLLGVPADGERSASVVLLDYGGRVVRAIEPPKPAEPVEEEPEDDGLGPVTGDPIAADVRKLLPMRPAMEK